MCYLVINPISDLSPDRKHFVELAFEIVGLDYQEYLVQDRRLIRPADVDLLIGDPSKARAKLGWESRTPFDELVRIMVESECRSLENGL